MVKILWVEDQTHWITKFKSVLEQADLSINGEIGTDNDVQVFKFAEAACMHIAQSKQAPDIAILDANMNGNDQAGFSVSRALHKSTVVRGSSSKPLKKRAHKTLLPSISRILRLFYVGVLKPH
jgi:CheY-like chemotaxis protein